MSPAFMCVGRYARMILSRSVSMSPVDSRGAAGWAGRVEKADLLGGGALSFVQTDQALVINLPEGRPVATAPAVRLSGSGLT